MTLKEYVAAAVTKSDLELAYGFEHYDLTARIQSGPVIFISDCGSESCGACMGIDGSRYREAKVKIKLTALLPYKHGNSDVFETIFSHIELDDSFSSVQFSVSAAKASAAHKKIMREAYISAVQLLSEYNDSEESDAA